MQECSFPFEILVHDDASTDGTTAILQKYAAEHPTKIQLFTEEENQYSQGVGIHITYLWPNARGKYIAQCEGDDYWTDPLKLQKQVDFLESHPEYSLCGHNTKIVYENDGGRIEYFRPHRSKQTKTELDMSDMILDFHSFHTSSFLFRRDMLETPKWFGKCRSGDIALSHLLASKGPVHYMDEVMSVYRVNDGGITQNHGRKDMLPSRMNWLMMYRYMDQEFHGKFRQSFQKRSLQQYQLLFYQCREARDWRTMGYMLWASVWFLLSPCADQRLWFQRLRHVFFQFRWRVRNQLLNSFLGVPVLRVKAFLKGLNANV